MRCLTGGDVQKGVMSDCRAKSLVWTVDRIALGVGFADWAVMTNWVQGMGLHRVLPTRRGQWLRVLWVAARWRSRSLQFTLLQRHGPGSDEKRALRNCAGPCGRRPEAGAVEQSPQKAAGSASPPGRFCRSIGKGPVPRLTILHCSTVYVCRLVWGLGIWGIIKSRWGGQQKFVHPFGVRWLVPD